MLKHYLGSIDDLYRNPLVNSHNPVRERTATSTAIKSSIIRQVFFHTEICKPSKVSVEAEATSNNLTARCDKIGTSIVGAISVA